MNILSKFPEKSALLNWYNEMKEENIREVNAHFHTPFSFSAFNNLDEVFKMATEEGVDVLGINDFFVTDGYEEFYNLSLQFNKFPLFNIEFIALLKEEQKNNIRINDPNNPGRIYVCGKGLDYPFNIDEKSNNQLEQIKRESQQQIRDMIDKVNILFSNMTGKMELSYDEIKKRYAKHLVRERHIARAIRELMVENCTTEKEKYDFLRSLYGDKEPKADLNNATTLENEIRGNLLKAGGRAFVEEDDASFLPLHEVTRVIRNAGGIPCYPVLLDDNKGNFTDFEGNWQKLYDNLLKNDITAIELIPGRNSFNVLKDFVKFFNDKNFLVTFGTEHNSPEMIPLTMFTRENKKFDVELRAIAYEGACVIAAHQYLRSFGNKGYTFEEKDNKKEYVKLGKAVIEKFLSMNQKS